LLDTYDDGSVIDWFPEDHPPMPAVVQHGPAAMGALARGCAACHLPNGKGRPENAALAGLPVGYFLRQIDDFRAGRRHSADPRKRNTPTMVALARGMSDAEARAASEYYAGLPASPWLRVVESDDAPAARISGNLYVATGDGQREPLAGRILEMPEDAVQSEDLGNPRSGFFAYASPASIARGRALATACTACHGADLQGRDDIPPIAGRSPSYLARQLYDFRSGARNGAMAAPMQAVVAKLSSADIADLAAYVARQGR
jgi:cytochrome c553